MDAPRFDRWTRSLTRTTSRRSMLGLAGTALGLAATRFPGSATAKKKHQKKAPKKLTRNSFGCVDVGKACRGNSGHCCSGICEGKKPKKGKKDTSQCVAHNDGGCLAEEDGCTIPAVACGTMGACYRTTGKASFCAKVPGTCEVCSRDTDCIALGYGQDSACTVCAGCIGINGSNGTGCFVAAA